MTTRGENTAIHWGAISSLPRAGIQFRISLYAAESDASV